MLRREFEVTLDELSERSGVDRAAIHKIENTERYPDYEPGLDTFRRLVEGLGFSMPEFFTRLPRLHFMEPPPPRPKAAEETKTSAHPRAATLLDLMSDEGQQAALTILESLSRSFPRVQQQQQSPSRKPRTRQAKTPTNHTARGKR